MHKGEIKIFKLLVCACIGALAGDFLCLMLLIPVLWVHSKSNYESFSIIFVYYSSATLAIAFDTVNWTGNFVIGNLLWEINTLLLVLPYIIFWTKDRNRRVVAIVVILSLLAFCPFGLANPLICSGLIFSGFGIWGLVLCLVLVVGLSILYEYSSFLVLMVIFLITLNSTFLELKTSEFKALDTEYNFAEIVSDLEQYNHIMDLKEKLRSFNEDDVVILPEGSLGTWNEISKEMWQKDNKVTSIAGAYREGEILVLNYNGESKIIYKQKIPLPLYGFKVSLKNSTFSLKGQRILPIICFESLIVLPFLVFEKVDTIICSSSLYWARTDTFSNLQRNILKAWGLLFDASVVHAVNTGEKWN